MKLVTILVVAAVFGAAAAAHESTATRLSLDFLEQPAINPELIAQVNSNRASTWTAGVNEYFKDMTVGDVVAMLGSPEEPLPFGMPVKWPSIDNDFGAPKEFDGRTDKQWHGCVSDIRDQGRCGSCWAFSTGEGLTDRYCIATKGEHTCILSPQDLVSCDTSNYGCGGGSGYNSWNYLYKTGIVSEKCFPYESGQSGREPACPSDCPSGEGKWKKHKTEDVYSVPNDEDAIRQELFKNGPTYMRFDVYNDFLQYKEGVYKHESGGRLGGHAIKPIGWGEEDGVKYWLIANSWGTDWGMQGYFKILRGENECGIEGGCVGGTVDNKAAAALSCE